MATDDNVAIRSIKTPVYQTDLAKLIQTISLIETFNVLSTIL